MYINPTQDHKYGTVLVTGSAGFIGGHVCMDLLSKGFQVWGIDRHGLDCELPLQHKRLKRLLAQSGFTFSQLDIGDFDALQSAFSKIRPTHVIHLAAESGVRFKAEKVASIGRSNLDGFLNVLECVRREACRHLIFASSSSVYGAASGLPYSVNTASDSPLSLYAATKKSNELLAHAYASQFHLPMTCLRLFSVYGPWGRPDMIISEFTHRIINAQPIMLFNNGAHERDFIYIDDTVALFKKSLTLPPPANSSPPFRVYNVGSHQSVSLLALVDLLEKILGKKAIVKFCPRDKSDMLQTRADISETTRDFDFAPTVSLIDGLTRFCGWYREEIEN